MLLRILNQLEESLLSLLLVMMTILVFVEVVARFVFNHGIIWAQELTLIMNSWMVLLGSAYCIRKKAHIGVDFLTNKLNRTTARVVVLFALTACLIYSAIFLYGSIIYILADYQISIELDDLPIQTWIPASILIIGFGLIALRFLQAFYQVIINDNIHVLQHAGEVEDSIALANNIKKFNADSNTIKPHNPLRK
ncbi:MAG: TRAP transporter small permease [Ostreibacterium sp.]